MTYSSLKQEFAINLRNVKECSTTISRIDEACKSLTVTLYRPDKNAKNYEPKSPESVDEKDIVVFNLSRSKRRGYLRRLRISKGIECPWERKKISYDKQEGLRFIFYVNIEGGGKTLSFNYNPKIIECPYCGKGYNELVKKRIDYFKRAAKESNKLAEKGAKLIIGNSRWRGFRHRKITELRREIEKEIQQEDSKVDVKAIQKLLLERPEYLMALPGSEELEKFVDELTQIKQKISNIEEGKMKVLKYKTIFPEIKLRSNYCYIVKRVTGEIIELSFENETMSKEEQKKMDIVEILSTRREFPHWGNLKDECKLEITQNLEALASWLEEQIPLIPQ